MKQEWVCFGWRGGSHDSLLEILKSVTWEEKIERKKGQQKKKKERKCFVIYLNGKRGAQKRATDTEQEKQAGAYEQKN